MADLITTSTIKAFQNRQLPGYGEGQYVLALYASFPVGYTADMLYQIRKNFWNDERYEPIPLVAINDLLMSPLSRSVGNGIFEMDEKVRHELLEEFRTKYDDRFYEMAQFLHEYAKERLSEPRYRQFRETLKMNANATLNPVESLRAISEKLQQALQQNNRAEVMRLRELLETFARQEKGSDNMEESTFFPWLQYSIALKGGYMDVPDHMVKEKIEQARSADNKGFKFYLEKPDKDAVSVPLPESLFKKKIIEKRENILIDKDAPGANIATIRALLIGISNYRSNPQWRLRGPVNDVDLIRNFLLEKYPTRTKIQTLCDEEATKQGILEHFHAQIMRSRPNDFIFFAFSGHSMEKNLISYNYYVDEKERINIVRVSDLIEIIKSNPKINFIFWLDGSDGNSFYSERLDNLVVLNSASEKESAKEKFINGKSYSIFAYYGIKLLKEKTDISYQDFIKTIAENLTKVVLYQKPNLFCTPSNEHKIIFKDQLITDLSEAIKRIKDCQEKNAKTLNLTGLKLTELPDELFKLKQLESLDLYDNLLTELPERIGELNNLKELLASKNKLTELPENIGELKKLTTIKLDENNFKFFPEILTPLKSIQYISLEDNHIDVLHHTVQNIENLRSLDVRNNPVWNIPDGRKKFTRGALHQLFSGIEIKNTGPKEIVVIASSEENNIIERALSSFLESNKVHLTRITGSPSDWYRQLINLGDRIAILHIGDFLNKNKKTAPLEIKENDRGKFSCRALMQFFTNPVTPRLCVLNYENSGKDVAFFNHEDYGFDVCISLTEGRLGERYSLERMYEFYNRLGKGATVEEAISERKFREQKTENVSELDQLKERLNHLLTELEFESCFKELQKVLSPSSEKHDQLILLNNRYQRLIKYQQSRTISYDEIQLQLNNIRQNLHDLIYRLNESDISKTQNSFQRTRSANVVLENFKIEISSLIADENIEQAIVKLLDKIDKDSNIYTKLLLVENHYEMYRLNQEKGNFTFEDEILEENKISMDLLDLISKLDGNDLKDRFQDAPKSSKTRKK